MPDPAGGIGWGVWSLWILLAYLLGSAPVGYLAARSLKGIDIREHGSRNPGAANVARVVGKGAGLFTLFADILKGWAPAFLALPAYPEWNVFAASVGLAAIAGHNWTVFLRFRGGKGVATSAGVFLALAPLPTAIAFAGFAAGLAVSRRVSVGSMTGALCLVLAAWRMEGPGFVTALAAACGVLIVFLHRKNIVRLARGEEPMFTFRKEPR